MENKKKNKFIKTSLNTSNKNINIYDSKEAERYAKIYFSEKHCSEYDTYSDLDIIEGNKNKYSSSADRKNLISNTGNSNKDTSAFTQSFETEENKNTLNEENENENKIIINPEKFESEKEEENSEDDSNKSLESDIIENIISNNLSDQTPSKELLNKNISKRNSTISLSEHENKSPRDYSNNTTFENNNTAIIKCKIKENLGKEGDDDMIQKRNRSFSDQ